MTIAAAFVPQAFFACRRRRQRLFQVDPFSQLLALCHWQEGKLRDTPVIVIVHGLEGSADSYYVEGIAEKAFHRGFHVVRLNQRNCGGTEKLTPTFITPEMSGDYRAVFEELASVDGFERFFSPGYSMGGNLVTKMAGEYGDDVPEALRRRLLRCARRLTCRRALMRWNGRTTILYQRHFVKGLMARYARKVQMFPDRYPRNGFGPIRTVREFDDAITAPCFGFRGCRGILRGGGSEEGDRASARADAHDYRGG